MIFSYTGFKIDIPGFYSSLPPNQQPVFLFIVNFVITAVAFAFLLTRLNTTAADPAQYKRN